MRMQLKKSNVHYLRNKLFLKRKIPEKKNLEPLLRNYSKSQDLVARIEKMGIIK